VAAFPARFSAGAVQRSLLAVAAGGPAVDGHGASPWSLVL
jgi:hypothetical protein